MEGCLIRFLLILLPSVAWADAVNNEWFSTTRSQSMGNTGIASADDGATAMFYNPAALSRTKKASFELFNPQVEVGTGVFNIGAGVNGPKHLSLKQVKPLLERKPNVVSTVGSALYPNVNAQNFNFGVLMRGEGTSYYDGTSLHYRSKYYLIPTLGISVGALSGRFRLGVAVRGIQATENDKELVGLGGDNVGYTMNAQEGFGIGLDAGTLLTLPWGALPTIGFVARNIGDTSFSGAAPAGVATGIIEAKDKVKMTYDAGFSLSPKIGKRSTLVFSADYRDILQVHDVSQMRRINLGMEFDISRVFYLRAGVSRGYWTAGMGLSSKYGSLDIGSYAEELSASAFRSREDRRISLRYGSRF